jgi:hypothetical protein
MAKIIDFPNSSPSAPIKKLLDDTSCHMSREPRRYSFLPWCGRVELGFV